MKKQTKKLAIALLALGCVSICAGTGLATACASAPNVTVNAETPVDYATYNINRLGVAGGCTASVIYAYTLDGDALPKEQGDWDNLYTLEAGSGAGMMLNDTVLSGTEIKQPGDLYLNLGVDAAEGDVFTIDGVYYNETTARKFVFNNCKLVFNGATWEAYKEPATEYNLGALTLHANSWLGGAKEANDQLFMIKTDGTEIPYPDGTWSTVFTLKSGDGLKVNGNVVNILEMKSTDAGVWMKFDGVNVGDVVTVSGTFYCETKNAEYVIAESKFQFNGSQWDVYVEPETPVEPEEPVEYATYTVDAIKAENSSSATTLYIIPADGDGNSLGTGDWDNVYTLEAGSGAGLKLNDTVLSTTDIKQPGSFFIALGVTAAEGDVLTIDGVYYNETTAKKIVFNNCTITYTGGVWVGEEVEEPETPVEPEEPIDYATYTVDAIKAENSSNATTLYIIPADGDGNSLGAGDWDNVYTLEEGSGAGLKLNDTVLSTTDIKQPGSFFIGLGVTAAEGDVLTIDGAYYNNTTAKKIVFNNCTITYTGGVWVGEEVEEPETPVEPEEPVEYTTYNINQLGVANGCTASVIYAYPTDGDALSKDVEDWANAYTFEAGSGAGMMLNDTVLSETEIKQPGDLYLSLGKTVAAEGDVFTIDGVYYNATTARKFVFNNCKLVFNGTTWEAEVEEEPETPATEYNLGTLILHANSWLGGAGTVNNQLFMIRQNEEALPYPDGTWNTIFTLKSGDGLKVNGNVVTILEMKSTDAGVWMKFDGVNAGDVVTVSGTFYCEKENAEYVIEESKFTWDGEKWVVGEIEEEPETPVEYTTYNINQLGATGDSNASVVYGYTLDGDALPKEQGDWANAYTLEAGSGAGMMLNDTVLSGTEVKQPGDLYLKLGVDAAEGDVFTIDGVYYNETTARKFVFNNCKLVFNGTTWVVYEEPIDYAIYTVDAIKAENSSSATAVYLIPANGDGNSLGTGDWDNVYTFEAGSGAGLKLNDTVLSTTDIKQPGSFFIALGVTAAEGDVLTIDGAYYNNTTAKKIVFNNCTITYTGGVWVGEEVEEPETPVEPEEPVEYTTYNINQLGAAGGCSASVIYGYTLDGDALPKEQGDWDNAYTLEAGSGAGMMLNDTVLSGTEIKQPGDLYINLGVDAVEGDVLTIDGVYYNATTARKFVFNNCQLVFNGTTWVSKAPVTPPVDPTVYELGSLVLHANSWNCGPGTVNNQIFMIRQNEEALPYPDKNWTTVFILYSGDGLKVNGNVVDIYEIKSTDAGVWMLFDGVNKGDVITVSGTFYCAKENAEYVIEESTFTWDGEKWVVGEIDIPDEPIGPIEYTTYNVDEVKAESSSNSSAVYLIPADGDGTTLGAGDWEKVYVFEEGSGAGLKLNDTVLTTTDIKQPGSFFISLGETAVAGDILTIDGTYYNTTTAKKIVFSNCKLIFDGEVWENYLEAVKTDAKEALEAYKATFVEENYYEAEWEYFAELLENGKVSIDEAATEEDVAAALEAAKAAMDEIVTKEESDAIFGTLKDTEKDNLKAYKNESDYRAADWQIIVGILEKACAEIDTCESVTAINKVVAEAKAQIDAIKTDAQKTADEKAVADAKAELAAYKSESDYRAEQWAEMQAITNKASADLDLAIGNAEEIAEIVADAKAQMDAVKTKAQKDADDKVVADAKAELAAYKTQDAYKAEQWTEIQSIIEKANADLDAANGDAEAIAEIVTAAKAKLDKVLTSEQADAAALEAAKAAGKKEVRSYYDILDHSLYTDEEETQISGFVAAAMSAIDQAKTAEEVNAAVAQFKANVDGVKQAPQSSNTNNNNNNNNNNNGVGGCGSVTGISGVLAGMTLAAAAVAVLGKKKKDE